MSNVNTAVTLSPAGEELLEQRLQATLDAGDYPGYQGALELLTGLLASRYSGLIQEGATSWPTQESPQGKPWGFKARDYGPWAKAWQEAKEDLQGWWDAAPGVYEAYRAAQEAADRERQERYREAQEAANKEGPCWSLEGWRPRQGSTPSGDGLSRLREGRDVY